MVIVMKRCGSLSKGKKAHDFDPIQLAIGAEIELEHTCDRNVAERIAMDHLMESPNYYKKLIKMEEQLEKEKNKPEKKIVKKVTKKKQSIIDVKRFVDNVKKHVSVTKFRL